MNAKSHAKSEHQKSEGYHAHLSKREADKADVCGELAEHFAEQGDEKAAAALRKLQGLHQSTSSLETERSAHHREMSSLIDSMEAGQAYARAAGDDLNKIRPDGVHGVIPAPSVVERIYGPRGSPPCRERDNRKFRQNRVYHSNCRSLSRFQATTTTTTNNA